jgi:phage-related minor tail protein
LHVTELDADFGRLEAQFLGLETSLAGLEGVTAAFRRELEDVGGTFREAGREASGMSRSLTASIRQAFDGVVFGGRNLGDALRGIVRSVSGSALNQALAPIQGAVGRVIGGGLQSFLGASAFASGGVLSSGRVQAFARGGVVEGPVTFPMRGGIGLMGEAGPEAIMPLARGADGRLGVRGSQVQGRVSVTINVTTPDAESFQRSSGQIAAELARAIQRGRRNL